MGLCMIKVALIPFASKLHGERYYSSAYDVVRKHILRTGFSVEVLPIISSEEEVGELAKKYSDVLPIFVALTGGVSELMRKFANMANYSRVILFGHGEHNSLPSTISAKAKMELNGVWTWLFHCVNVNSIECSIEIRRMVNVARAVASLLNSRVLLIVPYAEKPEIAEDFEARFEATVDVIPIDYFSKLESVREDYVERFLEAFNKVEFRVPKGELVDVAKIYALTKSIVESKGYSGVAIDCFPYLVKYQRAPCLALALLNAEGVVTACEGDLVSLALMMLSKSLTGTSGWVANASAFSGEKAYFAHCTIALNLVKNPVVTTHFESGYPYSLTGKLTSDVYTVVSLSYDFAVATISLGRVVDSGLLSESMCRTQVILDLGVRAEKIPIVAVSNHHVLIPGDVRNELKAVMALLGVDYAEYRDLVATL